jgi:hypothetical protein
MSTSSRLRSQDGFVREAIWIVVILTVIAVVILDGMAIYNAYQSAGNSSANAARAALTEYAQSQNLPAAKLAAQQRLAKSGLTLVDFKVSQGLEGSTSMTVTSRDHADTYVFHYLGKIPPLKKWVERVIDPVRSGSAD